MKWQIRQHLFETNSSNVHSLTMCMASDYEKWVNGEVLMKDGQFLEKDKAILENVEEIRKYEDGVTEEQIQDYINGKCELTDIVDLYNLYDYWKTVDEDNRSIEDCYYDTFEDIFTTPSGEKIVAFGYYGRDC